MSRPRPVRRAATGTEKKGSAERPAGGTGLARGSDAAPRKFKLDNAFYGKLRVVFKSGWGLGGLATERQVPEVAVLWFFCLTLLPYVLHKKHVLLNLQSSFIFGDLLMNYSEGFLFVLVLVCFSA